MAVRDGRIFALGDDDALASCASSRTQWFDSHGRTAVPGLIGELVVAM